MNETAYIAEVGSQAPRSAPTACGKEVKQKWLTEALKKEQLVSKELSARRHQNDRERGEVVANEQMCRN